MDMSDAPENAPTGPRRGSGRGGGGARRGGRKRAMAMADEDVAMGGTAESSTGNRPARKIRSSASHSASGPQHIKRASSTSGPYSAAKRPGMLTNKGRDAALKSRSGGSTPGLFRRAAIAATSSEASTSKAAPGAIEMLKQFLARRYNAEAHLLNLENMADDPTFKGPNALTAPGVRTGQKSSAALAMWKIIREQYPDVVSLSLADNNLISLVDIAPAALVHALPNLQNLSLKGNSIKEVKALNPLSHDDAIGRDGLQCLRELVIDDTPLWKQNVEGNSMEKLKRQIALRFPTLSVFTGLELTPTAEPRPKAPPSATPLGSGLKKVAEFPVSMKPGYMDESKEVVGPFLTQFFNLFDTNRQGLQIVYSPDATFSLSVNSFIPHRSYHSKEVQSLPKQHTLHWQPYFNQSRNMLQTSKVPPETLEKNIQSRLYSGPSSIVQALETLPKTQHPVNETDKFVIDAWAQPGLLANDAVGLFVSIHGQFYEEPGRGLRSFDRTFILAPPAGGSPAQQAGWPCIIISDLLVVRGYTEPKAWSETTLTVASTSAAPQLERSTSSSQGNPSLDGTGLTSEQQNTVVQLQAQTKLNVSFAIQCLSESSWDLATAFNNFQAVKDQIPQEAFVS